MSQRNVAIIYIEIYTIRNQKRKTGAICGELHYPGLDSSNVSIVGTNNYTLAVIAEAARLLEVLRTKVKKPLETHVIIHTTYNQFIWEYKDFKSEIQKRNKQQWNRFKKAAESYASVNVEEAGFLSRTVKEKAKFLLLRRQKGNGEK